MNSTGRWIGFCCFALIVTGAAFARSGDGPRGQNDKSAAGQAQTRSEVSAAVNSPRETAVEISALGWRSGSSVSGSVVLHGSDDSLQLIVTRSAIDANTANIIPTDITRDVTYSAEPAGIVHIDRTGFVTPLANGVVDVTATHADGETATLPIRVANIGAEIPVNFPNDVVPLFTKLGCNSGACHGKASGQNGFRLSLLGFVPSDDYEYLVKESRGRRVFPAAPDESLLLLKAAGTLPHGGGVRLDRDSYEYRVVRRWIAQGMPYGKADDPVVERIEVVPAARTLPRKTGQQIAEQQIAVVAHYSDGSRRDVTRMTQFEPNIPEMAEVSKTGLVAALDLTGNVAIMARFSGHVSTFQASIPLGAEEPIWPEAGVLEAGNLEPRNFVDEAVFDQLRTLGIPPSPPGDDATFLRRVTIDIAGRLPTLEETEKFLADESPKRRDALIDRLLDSGDYADYFANKWAAVLRVKRAGNSSVRANYAFHDWIRDSLLQNKPYDEFVREILTASGGPDENPPTVWFKEVRTAEEQVEDVAQLFLGLRIQCAKCHHHPFEKWSQDDYFGFAAFFSRVGRKSDHTLGQERVFHRAGVAEMENPKTHQRRKPTGLDGPTLDIPPGDDPRHALVDWIADAENPFFARALVNRYWKHFFGAGIVDPEDDMRVTNPPSNPELLDALEQRFIASGYDLKDLVRTICRSKTYQLSSLPTEINAGDHQSHSHWQPRRLKAEVLLDAVDQFTGTDTALPGLPRQLRAIQLPDSETGGNYFLNVFGRPEAESACECERSSEANLAQSLHLINSPDLMGKVAGSNSRAQNLAADNSRDDAAKVRELYLRAFSRVPTDAELRIATAHLAKHAEQKAQAYEDLVWTLLNTKEFLFNH